MCNKCKSVTLLELLIAIVLLSIVTIGLSSIDLFSRNHVLSADRRAKLQNEASLALEHMSKHIGQAIGDFNNPAVFEYPDSRGVRIKTDTSGDGRRDNDATDFWVAYRYEEVGNPVSDARIVFYENAGTGPLPVGNSDIIANHVAIIDTTQTPRDNWGLAFFPAMSNGRLVDNSMEVQIICRWNPAQAASVDNPQIELRNRVKMPSVSTN